jgi:ABC-type taurine transport system substrate-binding protein
MAPFLQAPREVLSLVVRTTHTITPKEMLTEAWMGAPGARDSGILRAIRDQAEFLRSTDQLRSVPSDFSKFVDSSFVARMV